MQGRHVSRRCFVVSSTKLIMPAFGSLTGGLDAHHPEIIRSVGANAAALVPVSDRLLRFPLAAYAAADLDRHRAGRRNSSRAIAGRRLPNVAA